MSHPVLNDQPVTVFVIIAETLAQWQSPASEAGKQVLMAHYEWAAELKKNRQLILAGPVDVDLITNQKIHPLGHTTGLIMLNVSTREEAVALAEKDPFHLHAYRKNHVHALKITMTDAHNLTHLNNTI